MKSIEAMKEKLQSWLADWRYGADKCQWEKTDNHHWRLKLYTQEYCYAITLGWKEKEGGCLGCVASARKPRAGETWTRGNDLHDGPFSYQTWMKILQDIVGYELVPISDYVRDNNPTPEDWNFDL